MYQLALKLRTGGWRRLSASYMSLEVARDMMRNLAGHTKTHMDDWVVVPYGQELVLALPEKRVAQSDSHLGAVERT